MYSLKQVFILGFLTYFNLTYSQTSIDSELTVCIDDFLSQQFRPDEPGIAVLVSRKGEIIYENAFGMANLELNTPMQSDNVFWIASMGKQFTAIAILQLAEQGKLSLHDEITKFIPDYPMQGHHITIEHLLTHTSGIQNFSGMEDPERKVTGDCTPMRVIDFFKDLPMRFAPGTKWQYSNSGYFLLGYIIEQVTGMTYAEYLEKHVLEPAGMTKSLFASDARIVPNRVGSYSQTEDGFVNALGRNITHVYSAGAIQSTVGDLLKWHQALYAEKLVKKESLQKAFTRYELADGTRADYGYGWRLGNVYDSPSIWHGGSISGFGAVEMYLPGHDVFVAILANCDCIYPKEIAARLASLAAGKPCTYTEVAVESTSLKEYTGVYEDAKGFQFMIIGTDDKLFAQFGRGPKFLLKAYMKDRFFIDDDQTQTIAFSRNEKGKVEKVTTERLNGNQEWKLTNKPLPDPNGIKVSEKILETYTGKYEITSDFMVTVTREGSKLYVQAEGQEALEMFAETESKFFLKVNDAQMEFVRSDSGEVVMARMYQDGRQIDARKVGSGQ